MYFKKPVITFFIVVLVLPAISQTITRSLQWMEPVSVMMENGSMRKSMYFKGALINGQTCLPEFSEVIEMESFNQPGITIEDFKTKPLSPEEISLINPDVSIPEQISPIAEIVYIRKKPALKILMNTLLTGPDGNPEKIESVKFSLISDPAGNLKSGYNSAFYADNSVLSSGNWYKFKTDKTGMHRITYDNLVQMGINPDNINPKNIRIYGNGGGMLPEKNSDFRYDDLQENAIWIEGENDNKFERNDYILFYATGPDQWKFKVSNSTFYHVKNIYSGYSYYFLTTDLGEGKRIGTEPSLTDTPNQTVSTFNDYAFHETDSYNLIKSGREWYGEVFDIISDYNFTFDFPDIDPSFPASLTAKVVARSNIQSFFRFSVNDQQVSEIGVPAVFYGPNGDYARTVSKSQVFTPAASSLNIKATYQKSAADAIGWLDYIEVNALRKLKFSGGQMGFRDVFSVGTGNVSLFQLQNAGEAVKVWEVTDPLNINAVETSIASQTQSFTLSTGTLREFLAFDGSAFYSVTFDSKVENQNLHALRNIDYVIVSHPEFLTQAERLAVFHRDHSGLSVAVVTPAQVYNEFSSGSQDISAIRGLMRMLYETATEGHEPRYLLLFGDASYDFRDYKVNNTNFVPTYQSEESLHTTQSYATDDFFGYLDSAEGMGNSDMLDIGVGRFPVDNQTEAEATVDKILNYATPSANIFGSWRNTVTFVADDEDGNTHLLQADQMAALIDTTYKSYNIDKIYVDAYPQISTPGGQRYPEVNQAINDRIEKGSLIMNYTGHGGEVGWGHERFLENADIMSWKNSDRLAVFITATCEFARYDDPERVSAGELVLLNPDGGGVGMFTTARATFGTSNLSLNMGIYDYLFIKDESGEYYRMGDLIRLAKFESGNVINDRKFVLLGDPALLIAYPEYSIETTKVNNHSISAQADTLKALALVTIEGRIVNEAKNVVSDFNGIIDAQVYDKVSEISTLANDEASIEKIFTLRNNVIYKGKARVTDGLFSFSFIVPKDIAYQYGFGKISYYATNNLIDALGFSDNIIVGGYSADAETDISGPAISLYMNDPYFKNGDLTHENPVLYALVSDESGVNTVGNSIGHDIVAVLDEDSENPFILNDYYEASLDDFSNGLIRYPFLNLSPGLHTVTLKIWDVFNNSSSASISFRVVASGELVMQKPYNYPNPFTDFTYFRFNINQNIAPNEIILRIFDITGREVKTFNLNMNLMDYDPGPLRWNGENNAGDLVPGGVYVYRVTMRLEDGRIATGSGKLIINR